MRERAIIGLLVVIFSLSGPASALARMEFSLGGEGGRMRLLVEGTIYNQSLLRSDDFRFDESLSLVSSRFVPQFELTLENLLTDLGPIDKLDFHTMIRPVYEGIYDMRRDRWGEEAPALIDSPVGHWENRARPPRNAGNFRLLDLPFLPFDRLHGYKQNLTRNQLRWERTDAYRDWPFRELYFDLTAGKHWLRLGKQQIVWGKADNFRLQDIVNPVDFGLHSFLEPWVDIRMPQWYINYQYQFGPRGPFENVALQLIGSLGQFQPIGIGQVGQPWATVLSYEGGRTGTAVYNYTKALRNDTLRNGAAATMPNIFAGIVNAFRGARGEPLIPATGCADPARCAQRFSRLGGSQILERWHVPHSVSWHNMQYGANLEFLLKGWRFALTYFNGRQDIPVDHVITPWSTAKPDPITGLPFGGVIELVNPRKSTFGLAVDYFEPFTSTVWRIESSFTPNKLLENWNHLDLNSEHNVFSWVIGIDRPTVGGPIFKWINPTRQVFVSGQAFGQTIFNHEGGARTGIPTDRNQFIFTFALSTNYFHDRLNPSWFIAWSPNGRSLLSGGAIEYLFTDHWSAKVGFNSTGGHPKRHYENLASGYIPALGRDSTLRRILGGDNSTNLADHNIGGERPAFRPPVGDLQEISIGVAKELFGDYLSRHNDEIFLRFGYRF